MSHRLRCAAFFPPSSKAVSPSIRAQLQREDEVQGLNRDDNGKSPIFNRRYIHLHSMVGFPVSMLVFRGVTSEIKSEFGVPASKNDI